MPAQESLKEVGRRVPVKERDVTIERELGGWGRDHKPRNLSSLQKLKKARTSLSKSFQKECSPGAPLQTSDLQSCTTATVGCFKDFPNGSAGKEFTCTARDTGDAGLIHGSGRSLEKGMANHSSILAWRIPWTVEPGGLQAMGSQRVEQD